MHIGEYFLLIDGETFFGLWLKITLLVLAINFAGSVIADFLGFVWRLALGLIGWVNAARLRRLHRKGYRIAALPKPRKRPRYRYRCRPNKWAGLWEELREAAEEARSAPVPTHTRHRLERALEKLDEAA